MRVSQYKSSTQPTLLHGFTLIELIITVAILGVLATLMLPMAQITSQRSKEQDLHEALREIRTAIDAYKDAVDQGRIKKSIDDTGYPPSLTALVDGIDDMKSPTKTMIYFLRRIPRDPFTHNPDIPPDRTWGLRSYASPADDPRDGDDVYDIYSLKPGVGLNGIPYRDW